MIKKILKATNNGLDSAFGFRIMPIKNAGSIGIVLNTSKKIAPKEYSAVSGIEGIIPPCQIEVYFRALNNYVKEGDRVLDVGFGTGYGLVLLGIKAAEVYGADVDKKAYEYCQRVLAGRHPKLKKLSLYDGYKLDYPDNYFDVITCVEVLEHVEDYHRFLDEVLRVSKRGVFLTTPNKRPEYTKADGTPKNYWHLREWTFTELDTIARKHGDVEWNCVNGPFEGPFTITEIEQADTLDLALFIKKGTKGSSGEARAK